MRERSVKAIRVSAALAALWLAACGGGGGGGGEPPVTPNAPAPAPATTLISGDTQAVPNTVYSVSSPSGATVTLTLPPNSALAAGDTVGIIGVSATPWVIAQNAGQTIATSGLNGNVAPGTTWTPVAALAPKPWHWVSMDASGQVLVAGEGLQPIGSTTSAALNVSSDGGQTWRTFRTGRNATWISSDVSANAERMVAVEYGGGMYLSTDQGATWNQVTSSPLVDDPAGLPFESVTISQDGQRIAAVVQPAATVAPDGRIVVSTDAGATWTSPALPAGQHYWRGIDSSRDGSVVVAVAHSREVFISTDAGATFSLLPVTVGGGPILETWYRVKVSADGNTIAIAANSFGGAPGTGIFVSHDRGATWARGNTLTADYTALAMSADGRTIAATASNMGTTPGTMLLSTDGGASFSPVTVAGGETNWRTIAMTPDATVMSAAAGTFDTGATGQVYTTFGNRTTRGTAGSIGGGQNDRLTLQYQGDGRFGVVESAGGPFRIR